MLFAARFAKPLRNSCLKISLLTVALAALLLPARAHAGCSNSTGNPVVTTCTGSEISVSGTVGASEGSSISVSGIPATVASMSITLNSLAVTGSNGGGLNSVAMVLVSPSGKALDFLSGVCDEPSSTFTIVDTGDTGTDELNGMLPLNGVGTCGSLSGNYFPSDFFPGQDTFNSPGPSTYDSGGNSDNGSGSSNFTSTFGLPASASSMDGTWTLYIATQVAGEYIPSGSLSSWSIAFTTESATATTTSVTTNPTGLTSNVFTTANGGPATSVTLTATVSPNPGGGTVTFYDSTGTTAGLGTVIASGVAVSGGQASKAVTFSPSQEGSRSISAVFSGTSSYASSTSSTATVLTVNHPSNPSGTTYCNGPVSQSDNPSNVGGTGGYPYPSQLILSGISGTIESVTVTLNGLQVQDPDFTGFMLQAPNGNGFEFMSWADGNGPGGDPASLTNTTVWLADGGSGLLQTNSQGTDGQQSCTQGSPCKPTDDYVQIDPLFDDTFPSAGSPFTAPTSVGKAYPTGSATFTSEFGGAAANGTWLLYLNNWLSENPSNNSSIPYGEITSWCLNFTMQANADATSTAVTASPNPASITSGTTSSVTFTATVSDTSNPGTTINAGTVTFVDGATTLGSHAVSNGTAAVTASLAEGTHQVVASYSGTSSGSPEFGISSGTIDLRVDTATTASGTGAGPYTFCNPGTILAPATNYDYGPALPYPSNIFVAGLPGTVKATSVTLNDFTTRDQGDLMSLLVGPGGSNDQYNLDFFSLTGSNVGTAPAAFNLTFQDSGAAITTNLTGGGPYEPSSKNTTPIKYPQCAQNASLCGTQNVGPRLGSSSTFTPSNEATSAGSAIFGDATHAGVFGGDTSSTYNGNGTWSLYIDDGGTTGEGEDTSITGGWCVNLTVNLPSIGFNGQSPSTFTQGGTGSLPAIVITNNGIGGNGEVGPIGDPTQTTANAMKVVDVLPTGLTFTNSNGSTDWNCAAAGQTVTCTNEDSVAVNASYSDLTLNVSVSGTASGNIGNNTVSVSDVEAANTPGQAVAAITVDSPPTISSANSTAFTTGTAGSFTINSTPGFPTTAATLAVSNVQNAIAGVNVPSSGTGSITINGTPTGSGVETFTITATNGAGLQATQDFTLTVNQAPSITSASSTTFTTGTAGSFSITSSPGFPATAATLAVSNVQNAVAGVNVPSSGTGSITINGTPTGSGVETFTITATNGAGLQATQNFTLTVNQAPSITSANSTTFTAGTAGSFTVTTLGYPNPALSESGALPNGITFTGNGNGTATLAGTATVPGTSPITITANNGISPNAMQSFTLTVIPGPATHFAVSAPGTATAGTPFSITLTALDSNNNTATGYLGTVAFFSSDTGGGVVLPANYTFVSGDQGVHTFTSGVTLVSAFGETVSAFDTVTTINGSSSSINVAAGAPALLTINSGSPQSAYVTTAFATSLNATLTDAYGNPEAGETVTFTSPTTGASAVLTTPVATNQYGLTSVNATANNIAGSYNVTATFNSVSTNFALTNNPPPSYIVTTTFDDATGTPSNCPVGNSPPSANCSLRDALAAVAATGVGNITFDGGTFNSSNSPALNTITLGSGGTLNVPINTTITGPTTGSGYTLADVVTVNGGGSSNNFPVFTVLSSPTSPATISGLTITNGYDTTGPAGGISVGYQGTLTLLNSSIVGNYGGGISNFYGTALTISNCNISGNSSGVGIVNESGTLTVNSTTVSGNSDIGILIGGGTATVTNSTITGNGNVTTDYSGGGVNNYDSSGTVTLANNIVAGNVAGNSPDIAGSYTDSGGNFIPGVNGVTLASLNLAPLFTYGGPTQTELLLPGSVAICGGLLNNATNAGLSTDQRGFGFASTYCPTNTVDAGSVQTSYALAFTTEPPTISTSEPITPAPVVGLTESGVAASAASGVISMTDIDGVLNGTTSAALSAGSATFSNLFTQTSETSDTLTATLSLNPSLAPPLNLTAVSSGFQATVAPATLTSPTPGSTLAGSSATFSWSAGGGVTQYEFRLGTTGPGSSDVYNSAEAATNSLTTGLVSGIPTYGVTLYARLYSKINGAWQWNDYTYTESGTPVLAVLIIPPSPTPGSTLTGSSATFSWSAGVGVTQYEFRLGTTRPGSSDVYNSADAATTSLTTGLVSGIPTNGVTLYARLYSKINGAWQYIDYTYTESGTPVPAALITPPSPTPESTLTGSSATFSWSAGVGVTQYEFRLGTTVPGSSDVYNSADAATTSLTTGLVSGIPTNGVTLYARLYSKINGAWQYIDYTYTEAP